MLRVGNWLHEAGCDSHAVRRAESCGGILVLSFFCEVTGIFFIGTFAMVHGEVHSHCLLAPAPPAAKMRPCTFPRAQGHACTYKPTLLQCFKPLMHIMCSTCDNSKTHFKLQVRKVGSCSPRGLQNPCGWIRKCVCSKASRATASHEREQHCAEPAKIIQHFLWFQQATLPDLWPGCEH